MISLKSKITFGIISLLGITVGFNLFYSYNLFVSDKKSYIFETALRRSENLADQINSQYKQMRQTALTLNKLQGQTESDLSTIFKNNDSLLFAYRVHYSVDKIEILKRINLFEESEKRLFLDSDEFKNFFVNSRLKKKVFFSDYVEYLNFKKKKIFYIANPVTDGTNDIIVSFFSGEHIFELLEKDQLFNNSFFLLESNQNLQLSGNSDLQGLYKTLKGDATQKGAREHIVTDNKYLLAYVKQPSDNFMIISSMPSVKAFEVTQSLILKTIFFAFSLLGFAVALGILFSISITKPIQILTDASRKITNGDFNINTKIKSNDELKILSISFDFMAKQIQQLLSVKEAMIRELNLANSKLEDYSKNLEIMVDQRTAELKKTNEFIGAMVNSLDQGLVVFDQDLKCNDIYTKAAVDLFGKSPKDLTFPELLDVKTEQEVEDLWSWAGITFSGALEFESAIGLVPHEKKWGQSFKEKDFKQIEIEYYPMRDGNVLKNIVAVATEKTNEIKNLELFKEKEQYVSMILKVLSNKTHFASFVKEVNLVIDQLLETAVKSDDELDSQKKLEICMMLFHTLNGGFGLFSVLELQQLARSYEDKISHVVVNPGEYDTFSSNLTTFTYNLRDKFNLFLKDLDNSLGVTFSKSDRLIEIPRKSILRVKVLVDNLNSPALSEDFYEEFVHEPISNYFSMYNDLVQKTANLLGKKIQPLVYINQEMKIDVDKYSEFFNSLVHLFRNCVDHGIESPAVRRSLGKNELGLIKIEFAKDVHTFRVSIEDDGGGINPETIRGRLAKLEAGLDTLLLSDEDIVYKIFSPFFSTKDEVSSISGRGVGMSAIKDIVDKMGGDIIIKSVVGAGTQFTFIFSHL